MSTAIRQKLQSSRKELLDIGLRNNMLNFRKTVKTLLIVDELSEDVFSILYRQEKAMSFAPMARKKLEALTQAAQDENAHSDSSRDAELLLALDTVDWSRVADDTEQDETGRLRRHLDNRLQTALDDERLFLQLLKIHTEAKGFIEEQGVNTLYLALGFLHWYEAGNSDTLRKAPLVLLPVSLERSGAKDAFKLMYSGDELMANLSLVAKLKTDFGLDIACCDFDEDTLASDEDSLGRYFADVAAAVSQQPRWAVAINEMALGFFSFGKFLMFKDLDPKTWPEDKQPESHAVMQRLLGAGFADLPAAYPDNLTIDAVIAPGDVHFIKDADSSQTEAILEVRAGSNLVIQGPPGTGKSQTITNILAELIGQKKTVLFVAEKMAALEVVKRRLDQSHLGDAVLELHSHKATKQSVLKSLAKALEQGRPLTQAGEEDMASLRLLQNDLNTYCETVSAPIGASGLPFVDVLGLYRQLMRAHPALPVIAFRPMQDWTLAEQQRHRAVVEELVLHLGEMGRPDKSAFWGSRRTFFSPIEHSGADEALRLASTQLAALKSAASPLSARLLLAEPSRWVDLGALCRTARRAADAPRLAGVQLTAAQWQSNPEAIRDLLEAGKQMTACRSQHEAELIDVAWDQNLLAVRQSLMAYGDKWWRILSGRYRSARAQLQGLARGALPADNAVMLAWVDSVLTYQQAKAVYDQHADLGSALFGAHWQGQTSDWARLESLGTWVIKLHDDMHHGVIPTDIIAFLAGPADTQGINESAAVIEQHLAALEKALASALEITGMGDRIPVETIKKRCLADIDEQLQIWQGGLNALYPMARFNVLAQQMRESGLEALLDIAIESDEPAKLTAILDFSWYSGLLQKGYAEQPVLQQFDRIKHEHHISRFKALDVASLNHAQTHLATQVWDAMPAINQPGEMALLRAELNKKRRHIPIRQLIEKAGRAIQHIKPIFMMSPMSIANFLPPGKLEFDVVVFDEASQVKAVDAFGAILRAKQVVVVGDTRQMPPTDFFNRDIELDEEDTATADIESILSLFKAAGCQERYLRWHYRSRHESLIAVSNIEFYDSKLVVFPAAGQQPHATGVSFDYLPDALYDRGKTRTNKGEAQAVAKAVMQHAIQTPTLSLGVAAFSVAQRDLIQVEIELLRRQTPEAEAFFTAQGSEPFFVKNLENIQGDERDTLFISIGYGRNESGRIAKEFGPLNRDGGHRRLNVLITRAKLAMRVFCNFKADELELDSGASLGVRVLKHFLKYAETGVLDVAKEAVKPAESPFESEVIEALRQRHCDVEAQVGTAGCFVDIGVKDPDYPGRYLLAIECDGASYRSARSARDRDRLRQAVLEGLGWNLHRIWSTDWFRNPEQEIDRVLAAIESAREAARARLANGQSPAPAEAPDAPPKMAREAPSEDDSPLAAPAYVKARLALVAATTELHQESPEQLATQVKAVIDIEAPVHISEVTRRIMEAYGITRMSPRITSSLDGAIDLGVRQALFSRRDSFLYQQGSEPVRVRSRAQLESAERNIDWVAPEELDQALLQAVSLGFSMTRENAITGALAILGFARATSRITGIVGDRVDALVTAEKWMIKDGVVSLPNTR
jgi:very-short-patch-repair endonuclease